MIRVALVRRLLLSSLPFSSRAKREAIGHAGAAGAPSLSRMGRLVYWMNVSLDLFIERSHGEDGGGEWMQIGEEAHREFNRRAANLSAMAHERVVYEIMEASWPTIAVDESMPAYMQEYGRARTCRDRASDDPEARSRSVRRTAFAFRSNAAGCATPSSCPRCCLARSSRPAGAA